MYVGIVGVGMEENVSATDTMDNLYKFKGESLGRSPASMRYGMIIN